MIKLIILSSQEQKQQIHSKHKTHGYYNSNVPGLREASKFGEYSIKINGIRRYEQLTPKGT